MSRTATRSRRPSVTSVASPSRCRTIMRLSVLSALRSSVCGTEANNVSSKPPADVCDVNVPCSVCSEAPSLPHQPSRASAALHARTGSTSGYDSVVKRDRSKQGSPKKSGRTRSSKQPSRHQTLWVDGGFRREACRSAVHGCADAAPSSTIEHCARAIFYGLSPARCCVSPPWRAHLYQQLCAGKQVLNLTVSKNNSFFY